MTINIEVGPYERLDHEEFKAPLAIGVSVHFKKEDALELYDDLDRYDDDELTPPLLELRRRLGLIIKKHFKPTYTDVTLTADEIEALTKALGSERSYENAYSAVEALVKRGTKK